MPEIRTGIKEYDDVIKLVKTFSYESDFLNVYLKTSMQNYKNINCLAELEERVIEDPIQGDSLLSRLSEIRTLLNDVRVHVASKEDLKISMQITDRMGRFSENIGKILHRFNSKDKNQSDDVPADPEITKEAMQILEHGNPLEYLVNTVGTLHIGDTQAAKLLILSTVVQNIVNVKGFHPGLHGQSGKGKSSLAKAVKHILPKGIVLETSLSGMALYYAGLEKGVVVFCDDTGLDEALGKTLKRATTNFTELTEHMSVKKQEGIKLCIPERIVWWFTSVDTDDDDQILNREISANVDESTTTDHLVYLKQLEQLRTGQISFPDCHEVSVSREIMRIIKSEMVTVLAPYATEDKISWNNEENRRNFDVFCDLLKSITALWRFQRKTIVENDNIIVEATEDDFRLAAPIYGAFGENQVTKLTDVERKVITFLAGRKDNGATIDEIQKTVKKSYSATRFLMHGRDSNGGLLRKVAALKYEQESLTYEVEDKLRKTKPKNRYVLDTENYHTLSSYDKIADLK